MAKDRDDIERLIRLSEEEVERLIKFYTDAEQEILNEINRALLRGNKTEYLKAMQENVEVILGDLRSGSRTWCEEAIPRTYISGAESVDAQLKEQGAKVVVGFGAIHQQAAQVLAEHAYRRFEDVTSFIGRRSDDIYRTLALENIMGSVTGYKTWEQVAKSFREQLATQGVTGFEDKAGRNWNLRTYAEMAARTTTMEAHLEGTKRRLLENGHDLIKVSTHEGACPKCVPWQGKVLSLTGETEGYPTLDEAKESGLFHPNCLHSYGLHIDLDMEIERLEKKLGLGEADSEEEYDYTNIKEFHDTHSTMAYFNSDDNYVEWKNSIDKAELGAIDEYTSNIYKQINSYNRKTDAWAADGPHGSIIKEAEKFMKNAPQIEQQEGESFFAYKRRKNEAIPLEYSSAVSSKATAEKNTKLLDSIIERAALGDNIKVTRGVDKNALPHFGDIKDLVGMPYSDASFMSTSTVLSPTHKKEYILEMSIPKGQGRGAYLEEITAVKGENEFLLARNSKFKIIGVRKEGSTNYLQLEMVP